MKPYLQKHVKGSYSDNWATPKNIYNDFMKHGFIDPCPLNSLVDNLDTDFGPVNLFINPPYSDIPTWVDFAINHHKKYPYNIVVLLVPARTDTKWFHKLLSYGCNITFIKGRLKFNDCKTSAPFPSIFIEIDVITKEGHSYDPNF